MLFRNLLRNSVHAITMQSYYHQILALAIVDLVFLVITCSFYQCFLNKTIFILFAAYQLNIFIMDALFLIHNRKP